MTTTTQGIKCGKCQGRHATVALVRACATGQPQAQPQPQAKPLETPMDRLARQHGNNDRVRTALGIRPVGGGSSYWDGEIQKAERAEEQRVAAYKAQRPFDRKPTAPARTAAQPTATAYPATDAQVKYLEGLLAKRAWQGTELDAVGNLLLKVLEDSKAEGGYVPKHLMAERASWLISELKKLPYRTAQAQPEEPASEHQATATAKNELAALLEQVPNGGYAVEDKDGTLHFYAVKVVFKDTGRRGVREQASDTLHRMYAGQQVGALRRIVAAGVKAAAHRYAEELGMCYVCRRTLTDETSRALGIGPICRDKGLAL